jgi:four helix bundle protein
MVAYVYELTRAFPKEELYGLAAQMRRAAVSVPANIAEGCARKSRKERDQLLYVSRASLSELETHLHIAHELDFINPTVLKDMLKRCARLSALIDGLLHSDSPSRLVT